MEYFEGGNLGDSWSVSPTITEKQAKLWTIQILAALQYCHANNVVHRDLKTENILKSKDGSRIAIVDFGMSHMWEEQPLKDENKELSSNTKNDILRKAMGTYLYFAPEMVKNKYATNIQREKRKRRKSVGFHGKPLDMWAFGVVLFKLFRGFVPYFDKNRVETLRLIANADPINDLDLCFDFSNELSLFIQQLLNPVATQRLTAEQALNHEWLQK
jgi:serine/threonine protein kinase